MKTYQQVFIGLMMQVGFFLGYTYPGYGLFAFIPVSFLLGVIVVEATKITPNL